MNQKENRAARKAERDLMSPEKCAKDDADKKEKLAKMTKEQRQNDKKDRLEKYGHQCMPKKEEVTFQVDPKEITTTNVIDTIGKAETQTGGPGDNASENSSGDKTNTDKKSGKNNEKAENPPVSFDDKQDTKYNLDNVQAVTSQLASSRASSIDSLLISTATLFLCAMVTFA